MLAYTSCYFASADIEPCRYAELRSIPKREGGDGNIGNSGDDNKYAGEIANQPYYKGNLKGAWSDARYIYGSEFEGDLIVEKILNFSAYVHLSDADLMAKFDLGDRYSITFYRETCCCFAFGLLLICF